MRLNRMQDGKMATITDVFADERLKRRLFDMGLLPGCKITLLRRAPGGDPIVIMLRGYELSLRLGDAGGIEVCEL